jgi:predicted phosphoribosyltransferase/dienelactone hydrolase
MRFLHRRDAGRILADHLRQHRPPLDEPIVVLGVPRGGVPVAEEVARALDAPLDVIVVRKLGVPGHTELAAGAIGENGVRVLNHDVLRATHITDEQLAMVEAREREELAHRVAAFRRARPRASLTGTTALIVDDGVATGASARAACQVARAAGATKVVLAVPVAPADWGVRFGGAADELVAMTTPDGFWSVSQWYDDFTPVTDDEVVACLQRSGTPTPVTGGADGAPMLATALDEAVAIDAAGAVICGQLTVPRDAKGVVVFVHGSGSSRHSPRNRYVAEVMQQAGLGTLLFDLLTPEEEMQRANVFDIDLLERRLVDVITWLQRDLERHSGVGSTIGLFGASTGAAAALVVAARPQSPVAAVVSRGGRPDLAGEALQRVQIPTLLIVGGHDQAVLELNRDAQAHLGGRSELAVVPGASHLFTEPGTLARAATLASQWFLTYL